MEMIDPAKVSKLIKRLQNLSAHLDSRNELYIHQNINQFYYMQRAEELKMLLGQLEEAQKRLVTISEIMDEHYTESFHTWRKDIRRLSMYLHHIENARQ